MATLTDTTTLPKGIFITLEGGEGAGKSSQIDLLRLKLESLGHVVVVTREPGGTNGAEIIRHVLLSGAAEKLGSEVEAMLFSAARSDHVAQIIKPALEQASIVLCDRFIDSTRVYQGATGKVDMKFLYDLEKVACDGIWPDLTLILDIDSKIGMERANSRRDKADMPDRFEKESMQAQENRRRAFLKIAKEEPKRCHVIDASGTEAQVAELIWQSVEAVMRKAEV